VLGVNELQLRPARTQIPGGREFDLDSTTQSLCNPWSSLGVEDETASSYDRCMT
jgi:hypothetical protein